MAGSAKLTVRRPIAAGKLQAWAPAPKIKRAAIAPKAAPRIVFESTWFMIVFLLVFVGAGVAPRMEFCRKALSRILGSIVKSPQIF
jgi:hypothetical protein